MKIIKEEEEVDGRPTFGLSECLKPAHGKEVRIEQEEERKPNQRYKNNRINRRTKDRITMIKNNNSRTDEKEKRAAESKRSRMGRKKPRRAKKEKKGQGQGAGASLILLARNIY